MTLRRSRWSVPLLVGLCAFLLMGATIRRNGIIAGTTLLVGGTASRVIVTDAAGNITTSSFLQDNGTNLTMSSGNLNLATGSTLFWSTDLALVRDAANVLAQRNGANAQELRVYETWTDATNRAYLSLRSATATEDFIIGAEEDGSGIQRSITFLVNATRVWQVVGDTGGVTGAAAGSFTPVANNSYDFGAPNARPASSYFGTTGMNSTGPFHTQATLGAVAVHIQSTLAVGAASSTPSATLHVGGTAHIGATTFQGNVALADFSTLGVGGNLNLNISSSLFWSTDLALVRDAANVLAQRNGTNAQELRINETWTSASERAYLSLRSATATGDFIIAAEADGTALQRSITFLVNATRVWQVVGDTGGVTGAAAGSLTPVANNSYDFGAPNARPASSYFGTTGMNSTGPFHTQATLGAVAVHIQSTLAVGTVSTPAATAHVGGTFHADATAFFGNVILADFNTLHVGGTLAVSQAASFRNPVAIGGVSTATSTLHVVGSFALYGTATMNQTVTLQAGQLLVPQGTSGAPGLAGSATGAQNDGILIANASVQMVTNATTQWLFNGTDLLPNVTNTKNLGSASFRPVQIFAGTSGIDSTGNITTTTSYQLSGVLALSGTAPTVTGFCTSPSVPNSNGTAAFTINVGTSCTGISTGSITLPAATTAWVCHVQNVTTPASYIVGQTGGTATTATVTNYSRTTGLAADWTASDVLRVSCMAY